MDQLSGVATTALLVNESRARRPELSGDRYASLWIPPSRRAAVRAMWEEFSREVYPHDDVVVSVRGRAVLDVLEAAATAHPGLTVVSLGAGFTSYPWLVPLGSAIEVDLPAVADAKSAMAEELMSSGALPRREVRHLHADLSDERQLTRLRDRLQQDLDARTPLAIVVEGVLYYLPLGACRQILRLPHDLGRRVVAAVVSYWPRGAESNPVLGRQASWFESIGMTDPTTTLSHDELRSQLGAGTSVTGPVELQRTYGAEPVVPEEQLVPEYVARWVPT